MIKTNKKSNKLLKGCRKFLHRIQDFVSLFLKQSGIHGLAYLVRKALTIYEKFLWLVLIVISLYGCIVLSLQSLDRFNTKSTVVSLEKDHYYWNTTLPSLTICPMKRLSPKKFEIFANNSNITGKKKSELWQFLESLANSTYLNFENIKSYDSIEELNLDPQEYMSLIFNLTENYMLRDKESLRVKALNDLEFIHCQQVLTEYGICYITNNYLSEKLSAERLITGQEPEPNPYESNVKSILHKTRAGNLFDGEITYSFIGFDSDITIFMHSPLEAMRIDRSMGYTSDAFEFEVQSLEIVTSEDLRSATTISQRKCRFIHESNLTHFSFYTKNICQQECRLQFAYKLCDCIPHFYPNRISNPKRVCSYQKLKSCFPRHKDAFIQLKFSKSTFSSFNCDCLQNCRESKVILENSQTMSESKDLLGSIGGMVIVKKYPVTRFKRQVLFTFTDLLVSIGGTAGFFLGFSVLGAVEIVYFFTLRLFWYAKGFK